MWLLRPITYFIRLMATHTRMIYKAIDSKINNLQEINEILDKLENIITLQKKL